MPKIEIKNLVTKISSSIKARDLSTEGKFPVYGAQGIVGYSEGFQTPVKSIAVIKDGAGVGRVQIIPPNSSVIGTLQLLVPKKDVDVSYLFYLFSSMDLGKSFSGATIPHIYFKDYEQNCVNGNSYNAQKEIGFTLDLITNVIDSSKEYIFSLNELIKSRFIEMFGEPTLISDGHKFRECAKALVRGPFGSSLKKEYFVPEGIDTYKVYEQKHAIEDNENIGTYYIDKERYNRLKRFSIQENDIIMSCSGTIGKTHIFTKNAKKGIINQALLLIRLDPTICNTIFFINQMELITSLLSTKGTAQVNIASIKILGDMDFLLPPIKRQNEFANFVEQVDKLKFNAQKRIDLYQELLNKKMDEYFN